MQQADTHTQQRQITAKKKRRKNSLLEKGDSNAAKRNMLRSRLHFWSMPKTTLFDCDRFDFKPPRKLAMEAKQVVFLHSGNIPLRKGGHTVSTRWNINLPNACTDLVSLRSTDSQRDPKSHPSFTTPPPPGQIQTPLKVTPRHPPLPQILARDPPTIDLN